MFSSALKSFSSNISANYTLSSSPSSIAGAWKVFDGRNKKSGKVVSVFVFDRKSLEPPGGGSSFRSRSNGATRRKIHDEVVERLRKEASSLARLRHPNILELAEPVEDTRNGGLMFATEPITATLEGLLKNQDDQERGRSSTGYQRADRAAGRKSIELDELEIQKGLLQVAKGLEFLHESAGLVHGNLTPEAIYINQKSDWKISGLSFSGPPDASTTSTPTTPPIALSELLYYDPRLPKTVQLNLDFASPDFVMDANISSWADMFSLGLVMVALYNSPHESPLHTSGNVSVYKKAFTSSSSTPSTSNNFLSSKPIPKELGSIVLPRLIARRPAQRMSAREFQQSGFFDNILVSSIRFLDSLPAKTPHEKSQFLRGLPRILDQFPKSVLDKKVLPVLLEETKDKDLLALLLGNVFKIMALLPSAQRAFTDKVLPKLRDVFIPSGKAPVGERDSTKEGGLIIVLENMALIADNCSGKSFRDGTFHHDSFVELADAGKDILPIVQICLESPTHALVDKALTCLSTMLKILDFSTIKNDLFPVVASVFSKTSSLAIKVRGLEAFTILCGGGTDTAGSQDSTQNSSATLDKYTVQEKVVPLLKAMKTKEPAVMMAALKVLKQVGKIADSEFLALDVLPILWTFSLGPLLNLRQFNEYMDLIRTLSSRIEREQTRKLKDLASNSTNGFDASSGSTDLLSTRDTPDIFSPTSTTMASDFERLVLGKSSSSDASATTKPAPDPFAAHQGATMPVQTSWSSNLVNSASSTSSRAITPDFTFGLSQSNASAFAGGNSGTSGRLQEPLRPTVTANPWASPPQSGTGMGHLGGSQGSFASPPQAAPGTSMTGDIWARPPAPQQSSSFGNTASINGGPGMGGFSQPLQPLQKPLQSNGFVIAPPPGPGAPMKARQEQHQSQGRKTGLDAFESLI